MNNLTDIQLDIRSIRRKFDAIKQKTETHLEGLFGQNQLPIGIIFKPMHY
jgi:hypothetical protein